MIVDFVKLFDKRHKKKTHFILLQRSHETQTIVVGLSESLSLSPSLLLYFSPCLSLFVWWVVVSVLWLWKKKQAHLHVFLSTKTECGRSRWRPRIDYDSNRFFFLCMLLNRTNSIDAIDVASTIQYMCLKTYGFLLSFSLFISRVWYALFLICFNLCCWCCFTARAKCVFIPESERESERSLWHFILYYIFVVVHLFIHLLFWLLSIFSRFLFFSPYFSHCFECWWWWWCDVVVIDLIFVLWFW